ncbi:uncharacterized protein TNCV_1347861 [Trichonephila clavipes]|nr:uncharacterized protein TNCV_1347861 [Trichonephila clavipes]
MHLSATPRWLDWSMETPWREDAEQPHYAPSHWSCTGYYGMGWYWISLLHSFRTHCRYFKQPVLHLQGVGARCPPYLQVLATAIFQQHNARPHVVRIVQMFFVNHQIELLPWKARSFADRKHVVYGCSMNDPDYTTSCHTRSTLATCGSCLVC